MILVFGMYPSETDMHPIDNDMHPIDNAEL